MFFCVLAGLRNPLEFLYITDSWAPPQKHLFCRARESAFKTGSPGYSDGTGFPVCALTELQSKYLRAVSRLSDVTDSSGMHRGSRF